MKVIDKVKGCTKCAERRAKLRNVMSNLKKGVRRGSVVAHGQQK